jgi:hypothetical protein
LQQLILRLIPQLTLPEAQAIFWHHGNGTSGFSVSFEDIGGCGAGNDPVVEDGRAIGFKGGLILAEDGAADCWTVPEEAVAEGGDCEGDACLEAVVSRWEAYWTFSFDTGRA